eukprot:207915-Chlamydomonas_euryale.AAC.7
MDQQARIFKIAVCCSQDSRAAHVRGLMWLLVFPASLGSLPASQRQRTRKIELQRPRGGLQQEC